MGGVGGGLVYNEDELRTVVARGLQASLVGQVLVEESILGWEELELDRLLYRKYRSFGRAYGGFVLLGAYANDQRRGAETLAGAGI